MTNIAEQEYPKLLHRIKAIVIDWIVLLASLTIASAVFSSINNVPDNLRMAVFIFIFLLYDPLLTSFFGGTIGHMLMGIRVRKQSDYGKNILFPFAILRFLAKSFLGWLSLLTVTGNEERKAIHDYISGSVVVFKS